jgi:hypothetical protein
MISAIDPEFCVLLQGFKAFASYIATSCYFVSWPDLACISISFILFDRLRKNLFSGVHLFALSGNACSESYLILSHGENRVSSNTYS